MKYFRESRPLISTGHSPDCFSCHQWYSIPTITEPVRTIGVAGGFRAGRFLRTFETGAVLKTSSQPAPDQQSKDQLCSAPSESNYWDRTSLLASVEMPAGPAPLVGKALGGSGCYLRPRPNNAIGHGTFEPELPLQGCLFFGVPAGQSPRAVKARGRAPPVGQGSWGKKRKSKQFYSAPNPTRCPIPFWFQDKSWLKDPQSRKRCSGRRPSA